MKLKQKIKFMIARILDRTFKNACWADLVSWSLNRITFRELFNDDWQWGSQRCSQKEGAYCGKCYDTERLNKHC